LFSNKGYYIHYKLAVFSKIYFKTFKFSARIKLLNAIKVQVVKLVIFIIQFLRTAEQKVIIINRHLNTTYK